MNSNIIQPYFSNNPVIGLYILRAQPFHIGHIRTLTHAVSMCDIVVCALGSIQEHGTNKNPFNFNERIKMIKNYCKTKDNINYDNLVVMGLADINDSYRWPHYVFEQVAKHTGYDVDILFAGSSYDSHWFKDFKDIKIDIVDRNCQSMPFVSGTMVREMLLYGDQRWMDFIPECNWQLVAKKFNRLEMLKDVTT